MKYRKAVHIRVCVACCIYKLVQDSTELQYFEMFAIGKSTEAKVLRDVVQAINIEFRQEIVFPHGEKLQSTMTDFFALFGLLAVACAIDGTQIHIKKPIHSPEDYYYFNSSGYTMQILVVVD